MRLTFSNIGKIRNTEIEINSISVIAGYNNTGKSTVSKVLFSIFNGLYNIEKRTNEYIKSELFRILEDLLFWGIRHDELKNIDLIRGELMDLKQDFTKNSIIQIIKKHLGEDSISNFDIGFDKIYSLLKLSKDDINKRVVQNIFLSEFQKQIQNINNNEDAFIKLKIKDHLVELKIRDNSIIGLSNPINLTHEAVYIDDIFILDRPLFSRRYYVNDVPHREQLKAKIVENRLSKKDSSDPITEKSVNELLIEDKLKNIYAELNNIAQGELIFDGIGSAYYKSDNKKEISIINLSTGLKIFVIIKTLLMNGYLEENGTLILDEPEVHLHPEWQVLLAKIIVLLQKEFNLHILISSHSHYFVNAIEVYSQKEGLHIPKFYLTQENEDETVSINDVSQDLEPIYNLFYKPLIKLEETEFELS